MLAADPIPGLRVLLVSCGAEETLQDGIRAFLASHRHDYGTVVEATRLVRGVCESLARPRAA